MNPSYSGPYKPAVFVSGRKNEKVCKKVLTSAGKHDIITKLSGADRTLKTKIKKTSKKCLTIETERDIINKLSRESGE